MTEVRFRNWNTNAMQQVHQYPIGTTEIVTTIADIAAANRIRPADGRSEVSLRQSVLATFSVTGFQSYFDQVGIVVR